MSDSVTDSLFINLKTVAQLKPHQRLNSQHTLLHLESDSWLYVFGSLRRTFYGDSRTKALLRINDVICQCEQYCTIYGDKPQLLARMYNHLNGAKHGIANLKQTYQADITTVSYLNNILDKVDSLIVVEEGSDTD